ncbi:YdeI/OmpD-associated family protein [Dactylosporangium sp. McL0621]|uniref:YdeI/OmpD-associated family protein n=1 Tax=Dactylosporangium sp. McL0621 TaxID=3415678 RepID=UPI003CE847FA
MRFTTTPVAGSGGRVVVPVPFDPDALWGAKARHLVGGTIGGHRVRGSIERTGDGFALTFGPAACVPAGAAVDADLEPEGPQRADLAEDFAAALAATPAAGAFFDALAQFYRKAYVRWIEATKRRPDERARRIAEVIALLEAGRKERPKP